MPIPTKLNEPSSMNATAVAGFAPAQVQLREEQDQHDEDDRRCGPGRTPSRTTTEPSSCDQRRIGAIIVYSSVPSQRSTVIVSAIQLKTTDR